MDRRGFLRAIGAATAAGAAGKLVGGRDPQEVIERLDWGLRAPTYTGLENVGKTVTIRRVVPFGHATSALTEGMVPPSLALRYEDVEVSLKDYVAMNSVPRTAELQILKRARPQLWRSSQGTLVFKRGEDHVIDAVRYSLMNGSE